MKTFPFLSRAALAVTVSSLGLFSLACCSTPAGAGSGPQVSDRADLAHGADLGWLSWLESKGVTWADADGKAADPVALLKARGVDAVRLRVMVNPSPSTGVGFTDQASVVSMAVRCRAAGIPKLMVDFHLSDTWADPGKQNVPAAWAADTPAQLAAHVGAHVTSVLTALKTAGVTPAWVQIGNEIPQGVLWSLLGKVSGSTGWSKLVPVLNAGYDAAKAVDPGIAVIVHLDKGYDQGLYQWWFDNYKQAGGKWDITGMSFYPYWQPEGTTAQLGTNLDAVAARYGKPVMVVEVGGPETNPAGTRALLAAVKSAVASVPGNQGLGVFYWEPASHSSVTGYALGACRSLGSNRLQFTAALDGYGWH